MEENTSTDVSSDVTPTASAPASTGAADAPVSAGDSGGVSTQTAPQATTPVETGEAEASTLSIPENDDDLQGQENNPHVQAVLNLRQQLRQLSQDHKDHKAKYADIGDVDGVKSSLELLDGLFGFATDGQGNTLYDQQTNLPIPSTSQFISKLQEGSPALVSQLHRDIWFAKAPSGLTYAQEMFQTLGLDPNRLKDYRAMTANPSHAISSGVIPPDEFNVIPEEFHADYKLLSPEERFRAQRMTDDELNRFMGEKRELRESREFREDFKKQQAESQQREMTAFWEGVDKSYQDYAATLRRDAFNSIQQGITSQVQFSADPTINAVQTGAVMSVLANLLNPDLRFATEGVLKSLGVTLDQGFEDVLNGLGQQAYLVKRYEAIAGNPALAAHRNDSAMAKAQSEVNRLNKTIQAKFNGIALKVARAIAGHNQELRDVEKSKLEGGARPTVSPGGLPTSPTWKAPPGVQPFTPEWLLARRQASGQG